MVFWSESYAHSMSPDNGWCLGAQPWFCIHGCQPSYGDPGWTKTEKKCLPNQIENQTWQTTWRKGWRSQYLLGKGNDRSLKRRKEWGSPNVYLPKRLRGLSLNMYHLWALCRTTCEERTMTRASAGKNTKIAMTSKKGSDWVSSKPFRNPCFGCQILLGLNVLLGEVSKEVRCQ